MNHPPIYLASNSPRRRELLKQIHIPFEPLLFRAPDATTTTSTRTCAPARMPSPTCAGCPPRPRAASTGCAGAPGLRLLLAADTTLELEGEIIGKPSHGEHAISILRELSGRTHQVLTAVVVTDGERFGERLSTSQARFRRLSEDEIRQYVATGEAADKAGAYGIQGRAALSSRRSVAATPASWVCPVRDCGFAAGIRLSSVTRFGPL